MSSDEEMFKTLGASLEDWLSARGIDLPEVFRLSLRERQWQCYALENLVWCVTNIYQSFSLQHFQQGLAAAPAQVPS